MHDLEKLHYHFKAQNQLEELQLSPKRKYQFNINIIQKFKESYRRVVLKMK